MGKGERCTGAVIQPHTEKGNKMPHKIEEFDLCKLQKAKKLISEVYEYYYGAPRMGQVTRRLETIMNKIDFLLKGNEHEK